MQKMWKEAVQPVGGETSVTLHLWKYGTRHNTMRERGEFQTNHMPLTMTMTFDPTRTNENMGISTKWATPLPKHSSGEARLVSGLRLPGTGGAGDVWLTRRVGPVVLKYRQVLRLAVCSCCTPETYLGWCGKQTAENIDWVWGSHEIQTTQYMIYHLRRSLFLTCGSQQERPLERSGRLLKENTSSGEGWSEDKGYVYEKQNRWIYFQRCYFFPSSHYVM